LASNKHIVVVSFNYRVNVFGFPGSADLPLNGNNLGFLDQELAFKWVQQNIACFGGDPQRVTIMGQSAGSISVSAAITRHS
ncbi:Carboxylesterase, partial [Mycena galopus ATCC 62051]